jgi:hypothetical protein
VSTLILFYFLFISAIHSSVQGGKGRIFRRRFSFEMRKNGTDGDSPHHTRRVGVWRIRGGRMALWKRLAARRFQPVLFIFSQEPPQPSAICVQA